MKLTEFSLILLVSSVSLIHGKNEVLSGGIQEISVDSPQVIRLSQIALGKINELKQGEPRNLVEIVKASRQVVSGILTRLTLKVSEEGVHKNFNVKILEQPWLNKTEVTVEDGKLKVKRYTIIDRGIEDYTLGLFNKFVTEHNKAYKNDIEYKKRYSIFRDNLKKIEQLRDTEQGSGQYGITWFADFSEEEFQNYLGLKMPEASDLPMGEIPDIKLPTDFDWRNYNVVTPVKDQKACGSCWAFSATGNIEGQWAIKKGELLSLSEQEILDCDTSDQGCEGGYMTTAFKEIMKMGGLETESSYPYIAKDEACHLNRSEVRVQISNAVNITQDETEMAKWLVKNGPISVALNSNAMQFYFGGISHPFKFLCNPKNLNHGVLIVGFGVENSKPFWIIKNSWGKSWGEDGYYRLYRGEGVCGVNLAPSSSIIN